jgi:hypothetical protein
VKDSIEACKVEDNFVVDLTSFVTNWFMRQLHGWPSPKALEDALRNSALFNVSEAHLGVWFPSWTRRSRMSFIRYYKQFEAIIERAKPPPADANVVEMENRMALMLGITKSTPMMRAVTEGLKLKASKSTRSAPSLRGPFSAHFDRPLSTRDSVRQELPSNGSQHELLPEAGHQSKSAHILPCTLETSVPVHGRDTSGDHAAMQGSAGGGVSPIQAAQNAEAGEPGSQRQPGLHLVEALLVSLELGDCWPKFKAEGVNLEALVGLSDDELRQLGVAKMGPRSLLRQRAAALITCHDPSAAATQPYRLLVLRS